MNDNSQRAKRLMDIYNRANSIGGGKRIPLSTESVFLAMELAEKACAESMQADKDKLEVMLESSRLAADSILKDWHKSQVANDKLEARVKELDRHAKVIKNYFYSETKLAALLAKVREDERERCLKICTLTENENWVFKGTEQWSSYVEGMSDGAGECADRIRSLK